MSEPIRDKAWITAHARMRAEERLRKLSSWLNFLTAWYSTMLVVISVYSLVSDKDINRDAIIVGLSVAVLSLSLFVPSLKLGHSADQHRDCYLKLQKVLDTTKNSGAFIRSYHEVLESFPNHSPKDYRSLVIESEFFGNKLSIGKKDIQSTTCMYIGYARDRVVFYGLFSIALIIPIVVFYLI